MKQSLTPKQVARAIGVSESSLKRWCDRGLLPFTKTAGGHRRLTIDHVLEFLRRERFELVEPEVLGLPVSTGRGTLVLDRARSTLLEALTHGDEEACTRIVFDLFLGGVPLATVCDEVLARAFELVGAGWQCDTLNIYQERRACELCLRVLNQLSSAIVPPRVDAPVAVGCTGPGDNYALPTRMIELVLRDAGWHATSLGCNLPFAAMTAALRDARPQVFWVSVSHVDDEDLLAAGCRELLEAAHQLPCARVLVGGRGVSDEFRTRLPELVYGHSMTDMLQQLADLSPQRPVESAVTSLGSVD
ncbi:MAG: helix-turn-helix domain-containing protein [Pirellulales bacterium]